MFVFLCPLLFPCREGRKQALSSVSKSDQADFTDWVFYLPSNHMEEISPNTETLNANTSSISSACNTEKII